MKNCFSILVISTLILSCSKQIYQSKNDSLEMRQSGMSKSKIALDSIISTLKTHSIYTNVVDWPKLEQKVYNNFIDSDSMSSIIEPTKYLLGELGDFHGFLVINGKQYWTNKEKIRITTYNQNSESYKKKYHNIISVQIDKKEIEAKIISDSIAYIEVPFLQNNYGIDSINLNYTLQLRSAICRLSKQNPKGYIIDLRHNLGGTVYPMLSGLGELFPNLELGGTTKDLSSYNDKWSIKDGNFHYGETSLSNIPQITCNLSLKNTPVAVLIGRYTSSSGEVVTTALKGQKNIKLIGEQTAGYTTTNGWFSITNDISINPSISFYMSEDKTVHKDGVQPDIEINEVLNIENQLSGEVIDEAIKYINTNYKSQLHSKY